MKKTAIFIKIAPRRLILYLKIDHWLVFKEEIGGTKKFAPDLVGAHGGDTWWGHLVGTPGGDTWWGHLLPTWVLRLRRGILPVTHPAAREHDHTHSLTLHTHTPKDIIRTQKINILGKTFKTVYKLSIRLSIRKSKKFHFRCNIVIQIVYRM